MWYTFCASKCQRANSVFEVKYELTLVSESVLEIDANKDVNVGFVMF